MSNVLKPLDAWSEVHLIDPVTTPIAIRVARQNWADPLHFTLASCVFKIFATIAYFTLGFASLMGPLFFLFATLTDSIDGKVGRLTGKHVILHGSLDFISDQVLNSLVFLSMTVAASQGQPVVSLMIIWLLVFFIIMSLTSTRYRLLSNLGPFNTDDPAELRHEYESSLLPLVNGRVVGKIYHSYLNLLARTSKSRTYPHPTVVDAEFIFFMLFPVLEAIAPSLGLVALYASILLMIPDLLYYFMICLALTMRLENRRRARDLKMPAIGVRK